MSRFDDLILFCSAKIIIYFIRSWALCENVYAYYVLLTLIVKWKLCNAAADFFVKHSDHSSSLCPADRKQQYLPLV